LNADSVTRYVRYASGNEVSYGILEGDSIRRLHGDLFDEPRPDGASLPLADARRLLPLDPARVQKVIGVAGNFQRPGQPPRVIPHPRLFAKFASCLVGDGDEVEMPPECPSLDHEAELVAVIGRPARHVSVAEAPSYVFGVAVGNDVSYENWYGERQGVEEPSRLISKAVDTWAALGSVICRGLDYSDLRIEARLDGALAAEGRTSEMINSVEYVVSYLSQYLTLLPGDLIYMGCPPWKPDMREMRPGQTIECEIEGIGVLRNRIVAMKGRE
jgi:2-keto-4-pentenoate hydratase/2-oxohepta-3-ene-1,7-dioic acid hydratase in catechol pathway